MPQRRALPKADPNGVTFVGWFNGDVIGADRFFGRQVGLIEVKNSVCDIPVAAKCVAAFVRYRSAAGADFCVPNAAWWTIDRETQIVGWNSSLETLEGSVMLPEPIARAPQRTGGLLQQANRTLIRSQTKGGHWCVSGPETRRLRTSMASTT